MSINDIRAEIEASRRAIRRDYSALRGELDFVAKAKHSIASHPLPWLGGSALAGWILSGRKRPGGRRLKPGEAAQPAKRFTILGILLALAKWVFPLIRPQLTSFALGKLGSLAGKQHR